VTDAALPHPRVQSGLSLSETRPATGSGTAPRMIVSVDLGFGDLRIAEATR
jgi:hypothetical protein